MSPGVVLCGYHRRGSWLVFFKKTQVRRRTAGCQEGWTPEAARRVGRSSVVMARAESRELSAIRMLRAEAWELKQEMFHGLRVVLRQGHKGLRDRRRLYKNWRGWEEVRESSVHPEHLASPVAYLLNLA
ncbi:hypothetical protein E2C01_027507 [Portunus trituberculatus]|uniref:Uncharacterized protein n=1 Tax=Portunus trituberculatus TaxID=210409 RepID=A0A5B7ELH5_PORTR|nr:hypothetical protein [Portunus trituberculatus]